MNGLTPGQGLPQSGGIPSQALSQLKDLRPAAPGATPGATTEAALEAFTPDRIEAWSGRVEVQIPEDVTLPPPPNDPSIQFAFGSEGTFSEVDADGDGAVTFEEYQEGDPQSHLYDRSRDPNDPTDFGGYDPNKDAAAARAKASFEKQDLDGDGQITRGEAKLNEFIRSRADVEGL